MLTVIVQTILVLGTLGFLVEMVIDIKKNGLPF